MKLEVLFTPADFEALRARKLGRAVCVVFDVLRATSSMITALANGARSVLPVEEIEEALRLKAADPGLLLAGERQGLRIRGDLAGGVEFDFGNSPREFTRDRVQDRALAMTTTNGTRALRACLGARQILAAAFLNLGATAAHVLRLQPSELIVVCSGTFEQAAWEDTLAAGALCDLVWPGDAAEAADSAWMARRLFQAAKADLPGALGQARNGRRLLSRPELRDDVAFCARVDTVPQVFAMGPDRAVRAVD